MSDEAIGEYDPFMNGVIEAPRLTIGKIITRRNRAFRLAEHCEDDNPILLREREMLLEAVDELIRVNLEKGWFPNA